MRVNWAELGWFLLWLAFASVASSAAAGAFSAVTIFAINTFWSASFSAGAVNFLIGIMIFLTGALSGPIEYAVPVLLLYAPLYLLIRSYGRDSRLLYVMSGCIASFAMLFLRHQYWEGLIGPATVHDSAKYAGQFCFQAGIAGSVVFRSVMRFSYPILPNFGAANSQ